MSDAEPIPGYMGQVTLAAAGDGSPLLMPCFFLRYHAALEIDALQTAASGPLPTCTPGFNKPAAYEFVGLFSDQFNPYSSDVPFVLGQTVSVQFSIYPPSAYNSSCDEAFFAELEVVGKSQENPIWRGLLVPVWGFDGFSSSPIRTAGGDNNPDEEDG